MIGDKVELNVTLEWWEWGWEGSEQYVLGHETGPCVGVKKDYLGFWVGYLIPYKGIDAIYLNTYGAPYGSDNLTNIKSHAEYCLQEFIKTGNVIVPGGIE